MIVRCPWVDISKKDYVAYHDTEWGVPVREEKLLFELFILESAQAGLSWYTILKKRSNYRKSFDDFNVEKVARYDAKRVAILLDDPGIIRNRQKIEAAINNAKQWLVIQEQFDSFSKYAWSFVNNKTIINKPRSPNDFVSSSKESEEFSKSLKSYGFKFIGPTTVYAYMQATGMVNDHTIDCFRQSQV